MFEDFELRQQIESIASKFKLFECVICAEVIKQFLIEKDVNGKHIKLFTGSIEEPFCNIFHEALMKNISVNGRHEAIAVDINEELIFGNLHYRGILRLDWLYNLYSSINDMGKDFQITEVDF